MMFGPYPAKVVRIHDGDTCTLDIDLGFDITLQYNARFYGINAPELSTQAGKDALAYLETILAIGDEVTIMSYGWDKYGGRFDGTLQKSGDPETINQMMLDSGHAVPMPGSAK